MCLSGPGSRGPSASKNVSFPCRASVPTSENSACSSITCMPRCFSQRSTSGRRSATQNATWSRVSGSIVAETYPRAASAGTWFARGGAEEDEAAVGRLRHVSCESDGIARRRRGRGFEYRDARGRRVTDEETLERIRALVIPPAWTDVWICPDPDGHLQAVGTDVAGRRQYLYHPRWRARRDRQKFDRMLDVRAGAAARAARGRARPGRAGA